MAAMLAKLKDRWASRGPSIGGLPVRRRAVRKANRAREKDTLRHQARQAGERQ